MSAGEVSNRNTTEHKQQQDINSAYVLFKHNAALALLVGAPILIAIPPRKLDLFTFSLAGAFVVSANHLTRERTGRSILQQFGQGYMRTRPGDSNKRQLEYDGGTGTTEGTLSSGNTLAHGVKAAGPGDTTADWKQKRLKEEQEKLDQGEGYADMIVDQIWDVWNQKKDGVDKKE